MSHNIQYCIFLTKTIATKDSKKTSKIAEIESNITKIFRKS